MSDNYNQSKSYSSNTGNGYQNTYGEPSQLPMNYNYFPSDTDRFYEEESSGTGSFLMGALVGGVIGAAAALFLAPKTGREMRSDFSDQAVQLKNKSIELGSTAKDKAADLTTAAKDKAADLTGTAKDKATQLSSAAKDKSDDLKKTVQDQSDNLTQKVKSISSKVQAPMDDGTASSEGEEPIVGKDSQQNKTNGQNGNKNGTNNNSTNNKSVSHNNSSNNKSGSNNHGAANSSSQAKNSSNANGSNNNNSSSSSSSKNDNKPGMSAEKKEASSQTTKNSSVTYDNSDNVGKDKYINQNAVSDEKPKNN